MSLATIADGLFRTQKPPPERMAGDYRFVLGTGLRIKIFNREYPCIGNGIESRL